MKSETEKWKSKLTYYDKQVYLIFESLESTRLTDNQKDEIKRLKKKMNQYQKVVEDLCRNIDAVKFNKPLPSARRTKHCFYTMPKDPSDYADQEGVVISFD